MVMACGVFFCGRLDKIERVLLVGILFSNGLGCLSHYKTGSPSEVARFMLWLVCFLLDFKWEEGRGMRERRVIFIDALTRNESWLSVECMERNLGLYFPSAFSSPLWVSSTLLHIILWSDRWLLSHLAVQTLAHFTVRDMKFVVLFRMPYAIS